MSQAARQLGQARAPSPTRPRWTPPARRCGRRRAAPGRRRGQGPGPGQPGPSPGRARGRAGRAADPRPPSRRRTAPGSPTPTRSPRFRNWSAPRPAARWGELPGHLRSEILQMSQGRYRDDYARLIQLYFREIAAGAGARPQDAEPMNPLVPRTDRSSARRPCSRACVAQPVPCPGPPRARPASPAADRAVKRGLDYLKSAQKPDGAWESGGFGRATSVTSLAVMAFLAGGPRAGRAGAVPGDGRARGSATSWPTSGPTGCSSPTPATGRCTATGSAP